ncbi:MAG: hypothetical protein Q7T44_08275 [Parvibaculum sp.]|nr:hypothetical protein [Parvibaculum sp.]
MEVKNNPAGRLHDLLRIAQQRPAKETARTVWATVFDVEPSNTGELLKMLADLIGLVSETRYFIAHLEDVDHDLYLRPFNKLETFFSQVNLDAPWGQWRDQLDETTLYGLQFSADKLSRNSGSTSIAEKDIESLREELEQLVTSVLESALPQGLKALFLRNLESIRHALLVYRIRGIDGLEHELERAVGSLLLNRDYIPPSGDKSPPRKFWERFFLIIDRINKVVTLSKGANELAGPAVQAISQIIDK